MLRVGGRLRRRGADGGASGAGAGALRRARIAGLTVCAAITLAPRRARRGLGRGHDLAPPGHARRDPRRARSASSGRPPRTSNRSPPPGSISGSHVGERAVLRQLTRRELRPAAALHRRRGSARRGAPQRRLPARRLLHDRAARAGGRTAAQHRRKARIPGTLRDPAGTAPAEGDGHDGRSEPRRRHLHGPASRSGDPPRRRRTARIRTGRAQRADDPQPRRQAGLLAAVQRRSRARCSNP